MKANVDYTAVETDIALILPELTSAVCEWGMKTVSLFYAQIEVSEKINNLYVEHDRPTNNSPKGSLTCVPHPNYPFTSI